MNDTSSDLGAALAREQYLRMRLHPRWRDQDYVHFADLLAYITSFAATARGALFDFGCGGAPYKTLFSGCSRYVGADIQAGPHVDRVLGVDFRTEEPDNAYDIVLSTQVLEHVADPGQYLREAARILKPGGTLVVTTHGMGEEHGCPWDFHRWTGNGLEQLVRRCGFEVLKGTKMSCGFRGSLLLVNQMMTHFRAKRPAWLRIFLGLYRRLYKRLAVPVANAIADRFPEEGVIDSSDSENLYAGIAVIARKPGT